MQATKRHSGSSVTSMVILDEGSVREPRRERTLHKYHEEEIRQREKGVVRLGLRKMNDGMPRETMRSR